MALSAAGQSQNEMFAVSAAASVDQTSQMQMKGRDQRGRQVSEAK